MDESSSSRIFILSWRDVMVVKLFKTSSKQIAFKGNDFLREVADLYPFGNKHLSLVNGFPL